MEKKEVMIAREDSMPVCFYCLKRSLRNRMLEAAGIRMIKDN
jgi:hypothetical protein